MDGLRIGNVTLFLGKIPTRKRKCFYFMEGVEMYPVAYVSEANREKAEQLWLKMIDKLPTITEKEGGKKRWANLRK